MEGVSNQPLVLQWIRSIGFGRMYAGLIADEALEAAASANLAGMCRGLPRCAQNVGHGPRGMVAGGGVKR